MLWLVWLVLWVTTSCGFGLIYLKRSWRRWIRKHLEIAQEALVEVDLRIAVGFHVGRSSTFAHHLRRPFGWLGQSKSVLAFRRWRAATAWCWVPSWRAHFDVQMTETQCNVAFGIVCAVEQERKRPRNPRWFTEIYLLIKSWKLNRNPYWGGDWTVTVVPSPVGEVTSVESRETPLLIAGL